MQLNMINHCPALEKFLNLKQGIPLWTYKAKWFDSWQRSGVTPDLSRLLFGFLKSKILKNKQHVYLFAI